VIDKLLLKIRNDMGLNQKDFADKLGVTRQYLCDVERGRRFIGVDLASRFAANIDYSEREFIQTVLQEMINRTGLKYTVVVKRKKND